MCPSLRVFACGFSTTVLHSLSHELREWLPENYPGRWIVAEVKLHFTVLHAHLTWIPSILVFLWDISELRSMPVQLILDSNCGVEYNSFQVI
jgi:hypothetical protein